jgi:hypothetical protein
VKFVLVILVAAAALLWVAPASAHGLVTHPRCHSLTCREKSQQANLKHARYLCHYGRRQTKRWGCEAVKWLTRELRKTKARMNPWGRGSIRQYVLKYHPCLAGIIALENASYDPTLNYGGGHGDASVAYGIPQATPGTKMASAGADWRTNPWTQLRWMIGYTVGRFGSECSAYHSRIYNHTY